MAVIDSFEACKSLIGNHPVVSKESVMYMLPVWTGDRCDSFTVLLKYQEIKITHRRLLFPHVKLPGKTISNMADFRFGVCMDSNDLFGDYWTF